MCGEQNIFWAIWLGVSPQNSLQRWGLSRPQHPDEYMVAHDVGAYTCLPSQSQSAQLNNPHGRNKVAASTEQQEDGFSIAGLGGGG